MNDRPNLLVICCDQLAQAAVGCYGDPHGATPNIDALAERGVRFEHAYCPFPLCAPARASFWTSRWPHQTGVESNGRHWADARVTRATPTLGSTFTDAGYHCTHFGKTHDGGALHGFEVVPFHPTPIAGPDWACYNADTYNDVTIAAQATHWLAEAPDDPWLTVVDLLNPHNICGYVGGHEGPETTIDVPGPLPELPDNFEVDNWEALPKPVQYVCCAHRRLSQGANWPDRKYREYLKAYYHFTKLADECVGRLLAALERSGQADRTTVVFFADHGDAIARRRGITKHTTFYEEMTRVPWIIAGAGVEARGAAKGEPLTNLVDLVPTLCDLAGLEAPRTAEGRSLAGAARGEAVVEDRRYTASQWHTEWGFTIEPGRMIRSKRYKYVCYLEGRDDPDDPSGGEAFYDLEADPGETRTLIHDPAYADALEEHRRMLAEHCEATGDGFFGRQWKADPQFREHAPGYPNHTGGSAPEVLGGA